MDSSGPGSTSHSATGSSPAGPTTPVNAGDGGRLNHLDNLRTTVTLLVVAHHAAQAYGPPDWWFVPDG